MARSKEPSTRPFPTSGGLRGPSPLLYNPLRACSFPSAKPLSPLSAWHWRGARLDPQTACRSLPPPPPALRGWIARDRRPHRRPAGRKGRHPPLRNPRGIDHGARRLDKERPAATAGRRPDPRSGSPDTPAAAGNRVYSGSADRMLTCFDAATGKVRWKRKLQGALLYPPIVAGRRIAVVASNSTLYFLSARGGSILSWEAIPSRIVFEPARAGESLLVSPAAARLFVFDLRKGERIGQHLTSGTLVAGAVWSPPFVVLFEEDPGTGRQRIVFLRSR
ncbi:MAG: PQQ-like beta-propeller repeat protein [Candidatus Moduliflexus flocculans]|nr:PQQ-like beta-propeller repeat protein [Candidatus Moduliflexus flocculans]